MNNAKDYFLSWLSAAHTMAKQTSVVLALSAKRLSSHPYAQLIFEEHRDETEEHARQLYTCLARHRADPYCSQIVTLGPRTLGRELRQQLVTGNAIEIFVTHYAIKHIEITTYKTLVAAAELVEDHATRRISEFILPQEIAMARWLGAQIQTSTGPDKSWHTPCTPTLSIARKQAHPPL